MKAEISLIVQPWRRHFILYFAGFLYKDDTELSPVSGVTQMMTESEKIDMIRDYIVCSEDLLAEESDFEIEVKDEKRIGEAAD